MIAKPTSATVSQNFSRDDMCGLRVFTCSATAMVTARPRREAFASGRPRGNQVPMAGDLALGLYSSRFVQRVNEPCKGGCDAGLGVARAGRHGREIDRKSTRLNS